MNEYCIFMSYVYHISGCCKVYPIQQKSKLSTGIYEIASGAQNSQGNCTHLLINDDYLLISQGLSLTLIKGDGEPNNEDMF